MPDPAVDLSASPAHPTASLERYTRIAAAMVHSEALMQSTNLQRMAAGSSAELAMMRLTRVDDKVIPDLPGKNPLSAFAGLASLVLGAVSPPVQATFSWGDSLNRKRYGSLNLENNGLSPEAFGREYERLKVMQQDVQFLVRWHLTDGGEIKKAPHAEQQFAEEFTRLVERAQQHERSADTAPAGNGIALTRYTPAVPLGPDEQHTAGIADQFASLIGRIARRPQPDAALTPVTPPSAAPQP